MVEDDKEETKNNDFADKQKSLAALLAKGPPIKHHKTDNLDTKPKIKTGIFDDDDDQPHSAGIKMGVDSLIENQLNKPTLKQERRPS